MNAGALLDVFADPFVRYCHANASTLGDEERPDVEAVVAKLETAVALYLQVHGATAVAVPN